MSRVALVAEHAHITGHQLRPTYTTAQLCRASVSHNAIIPPLFEREAVITLRHVTPVEY